MFACMQTLYAAMVSMLLRLPANARRHVMLEWQLIRIPTGLVHICTVVFDNSETYMKTCEHVSWKFQGWVGWRLESTNSYLSGLARCVFPPALRASGNKHSNRMTGDRYCFCFLLLRLWVFLFYDLLHPNTASRKRRVAPTSIGKYLHTKPRHVIVFTIRMKCAYPQTAL